MQHSSNMAVAASVRFLCREFGQIKLQAFSVPLSSLNLKQYWPKLASELLQLSLTDEQDLLRHLCKNCKAKVLSIEEKLQKLRMQLSTP